MTMTDITKQSKVSLALAGGVCTTTLVGVLWLQGRLNNVASALVELRHEQESMSKELDEVLTDRWTITMMENWALRLKLNNQPLSIPSAEHEGEVR